MRITFTPNLPKAILEELKALVDAGAELSQETILGLASFVPDVNAELKRVNAEAPTGRGVFDSDKETDTEVEEDESRTTESINGNERKQPKT